MSQGEAAIRIRHSSTGLSGLAALRHGIVDILSRRRLIRYLVQAEMKKRGSDTLLGNLWWILDPLLQMAVYVVFITIVARGLAPHYPLFIFAAILPWKWFSAVVNDATTTVVRQDRLIRQIAFPKLVLPVSTAVAGVVSFAWGMVPLALLLLVYSDHVSPMLLFVPIIAAVQFVFTLAVAILVSAANVFFRDLGNAAGHGLRLWWFLSPGLYSMAWVSDLEFVKENPIIGFLAGLNPFAVLFEAYRAVIYGTAEGPRSFIPPHPPDFLALAFMLVASLVLLALSVIFFKRVEPEFAKVL